MSEWGGGWLKRTQKLTNLVNEILGHSCCELGATVGQMKLVISKSYSIVRKAVIRSGQSLEKLEDWRRYHSQFGKQGYHWC